MTKTKIAKHVLKTKYAHFNIKSERNLSRLSICNHLFLITVNQQMPRKCCSNHPAPMAIEELNEGQLSSGHFLHTFDLKHFVNVNAIQKRSNTWHYRKTCNCIYIPWAIWYYSIRITNKQISISGQFQQISMESLWISFVSAFFNRWNSVTHRRIFEQSLCNKKLQRTVKTAKVSSLLNCIFIYYKFNNNKILPHCHKSCLLIAKIFPTILTD